MELRLRVLCENSVGTPGQALGEHGFACLIERPGGSFLFDTGQGLTLRHNAAELGCDLESLQGIVLSHGHYDHAGGLPEALKATGPVDVYAHPGIFQERYWMGPKTKRFIGVPWRRQTLEALGARFVLRADFTEIAPGVFLTGEVPRETDFEGGDPHLVVPGEEASCVPDPFVDDLSLVVETSKGLVLVAGCAHAGLVNIIRHVLKQKNAKSLYAVVGGTHLGPADFSQFEQTLQFLDGCGIEKIGTAHCTGLLRSGLIAEHFGSRFFPAAVGAELVI